MKGKGKAEKGESKKHERSEHKGKGGGKAGC